MPDNLNPNLITGIEDIDTQHSDLFYAIKDFDFNKKTEEALWAILIEIEIYTQVHFETEEKYMEKFNYPLIEEHIIEHRLFTKNFTELKKNFDNEGFSKIFVEDFQKFLMDWLLKHYTEIDVKMADFIKTRLNYIAQQDT